MTPEQIQKLSGVLTREQIPAGYAPQEISPGKFQFSPSELDALRRQAGAPLAGSTTITAGSLTPTRSITFPEPPVPTDIGGVVARGQGAIGAFAPAPIVETKTSALEERLKELGAPPRAEEAYRSAEEQSGINAARQEEIRAKQAVRAAQAEAKAVEAEIQGVIDRTTARKLQLEQESIGRGRTEAGVAPLVSGIDRQAAIEVLPLQAKALAAQAKVLRLGGDLEAANSALSLAQDQLNTAFRLKTEDAQNLYDYRKSLIQAVYEDVAAKDKKRLDELDKKYTRNQSTVNDAVNNAQSIATKLLDIDPVLASQITQLVPPKIDSPTFSTDLKTYNDKLAGYQAQIKPKVVSTAKTVEELKTASQKAVEIGNVVTAETADTISTVLGSNKVGAATRTAIGTILGVINAAEEMAKASPTGAFGGISPLSSLLDIKIPFTETSVIGPLREAFRSAEGTRNVAFINAINLKVQQWASGAALTEQQTRQVEKLVPTVTDTDAKVQEKLNSLVDIMNLQIRGALQAEGIDYKPQNVDLFAQNKTLEEIFK